MILLGKYFVGNYYIFLICFIVCLLNGLCSVYEINKNFYYYFKLKLVVLVCVLVV